MSEQSGFFEEHMRIVCLSCILVRTFSPAQIKNSHDLIHAMHDAYQGKWYNTVTFVQKTISTQPDGSKSEETWYEAAKLPGALRIDIAPIDSGNGMLFARDTLYIFRNGTLANASAMIHPLLLLGFDIYFLPVETTVKKLEALKFDLSAMHETTWQGRPVYVVGAVKDDLHSAQFWIDKERLYFVRMIQPGRRDSAIRVESQFNRYQKFGGGWIAAEVLFFNNGKLMTSEEYTDVRGNVTLDENLFYPASWKTARWRKN